MYRSSSVSVVVDLRFFTFLVVFFTSFVEFSVVSSTSFVDILVVEGGTVVGSIISISTSVSGGSLEEGLDFFSEFLSNDGSRVLAAFSVILLSLSEFYGES